MRTTETRDIHDIRDVARLAGVSIGTVSNVLNRPHLVADTTRARVEQVIARAGFVRNASARHLRQGRTRTIGLVVQDVTNPFFTEVARAAEDAAADSGYLLYLCNSAGSADKEAAYLRALVEQQVSGVLLTPLWEIPAVVDTLRSRGTPVVLVDRASERPDQCSTAVDDVHGGDLAASHLIAIGRRRLAFLSSTLTIRQCADRRAGVRRALRRARLSVREHLRELVVPEMMTPAAGEQAAEQLIREGLPDGIFCANDVLALGVLRGLLRRGVKVPQDVALIGYDDIEFAAASPVALSSIRQPTAAVSRRAGELLLEECDQPAEHRHQQLVFKPELVVRESTGSYA
jgi:LacI family transcriptional regulator